MHGTMKRKKPPSSTKGRAAKRPQPQCVNSESTDGDYCKYCALFAECGPTVTELGVLVNKPLTSKKLPKNWISISLKSNFIN